MFETIIREIHDLISDRYHFDNNHDLLHELMSLSDEELKQKEILRIKRRNITVNQWKTLLFVEIETDGESEIKLELQKALRWTASVKDSLLDPESTDLYLFLAFKGEVSKEECLRIESTEQFCRKYVLLPDEKIPELVERTFLQKLQSNIDTFDSTDPLERAFSETLIHYNWLTPKIQKEWRKAFSHLSGSDLADALINGGTYHEAH